MEDAIGIIEKDGTEFWIVIKNHTSAFVSVVVLMDMVFGSLLHIL
jgi:hypothetical protein